MDPTAGLDDMQKWNFLTLPRLELRPISSPARSQSLYRLRYPGTVILQDGVYTNNKAGRPLEPHSSE
jgi:hypothetical protein